MYGDRPLQDSNTFLFLQPLKSHNLVVFNPFPLARNAFDITTELEKHLLPIRIYLNFPVFSKFTFDISYQIHLPVSGRVEHDIAKTGMEVYRDIIPKCLNLHTADIAQDHRSY